MKRLYLIVLGLWLLAACAFGQNGPTPQVIIDTDQIVDEAVTILKTDGIAADDLSNVTPATGRAALGLGTMAVATATDYVATDTFTGHTGATGAFVHGLGTISTKADTDYVATSSLAARVDTVNASFTGDIDVTGDVGAATLGVTDYVSIKNSFNSGREVHALYSYAAANGNTIATFTVPAFSGIKIQFISAGLQQNVGAFVLDKVFYAYRNSNTTTIVPTTIHESGVTNIDDLVQLIESPTAKGTLTLYIAPPSPTANSVNFRGTLIVDGQFTGVVE